MKKSIATFTLILASAIAHADSNMDKQSYCSNYATMFKSIAAWRDQGVQPDRTLELIRGVKGISPQVKQESVQAVYFDKALANARGPEFGNQVRLNCLAGKMQ